MGYGAAISLLKSGFNVHGCNIRADIREKFEQEAGFTYISPGDAAIKGSVVLIFVVNADQVEQIVFGKGGII